MEVGSRADDAPLRDRTSCELGGSHRPGRVPHGHPRDGDDSHVVVRVSGDECPDRGVALAGVRGARVVEVEDRPIPHTLRRRPARTVLREPDPVPVTVAGDRYGPGRR